jgi:hypothetical protein
MAPRKRKSPAAKKKGLIRRIRKPMAPPARVEQDTSKYSRSRERQRLGREEKETGGP